MEAKSAHDEIHQPLPPVSVAFIDSEFLRKDSLLLHFGQSLTSGRSCSVTRAWNNLRAGLCRSPTLLCLAWQVHNFAKLRRELVKNPECYPRLPALHALGLHWWAKILQIGWDYQSNSCATHPVKSRLLKNTASDRTTHPARRHVRNQRLLALHMAQRLDTRPRSSVQPALKDEWPLRVSKSSHVLLSNPRRGFGIRLRGDLLQEQGPCMPRLRGPGWILGNAG